MTSAADKPASAAEVFLTTLKSRGVDWIFGNAGTDFAPVLEALSKLTDEDGGEPSVPNAIEITHETVAVAMAHGYYLMTGRPQMAMVHVNVGTANSLMGLINAYHAKVPVLFASGRTPLTEDHHLGHRNAPIHWGQDMFDQGGMVREFVKWDTELKAGDQIEALVDRALAISQSEPCGPVYLSLPRERLAEQLPDWFEPTAQTNVAVPSAPHPDPAAIREATALLAEADTPLIISSGGSEALFAVLGDFAKRYAIPVVQFWRTSPAIATGHPMYGGEVPTALLPDADVIVVLDSMVPWMPDRARFRPGAKIVQIGPDPLFQSVPLRSFPADLVVTATAASAIAAMDTELTAAGVNDSEQVAERRTRIGPELAARRSRATDVPAPSWTGPDSPPMSPEYMTKVISEVSGPDAVIVNELGLATEVLESTRHDSFFGPSISAGLGWGGGAALGVKLADPTRTVLWCTGDGSYTFSNPVAVHHAAASLGLGLVTVIADNRVWNAVRRSTIAVYPEGHAAAAPAIPLSSLEPAPDYPKFVQAYGGHGEHVEDPADLAGALQRCLDVAATGRQALLSVRCSYPDAANH